uniref:acidic amino acid decarboxylase GADL1-like n=1 Tax=Styela clava TaxID=7725 RepID=UPI0019396C68|nr:acidic amino acid decarboxylase GADL1-like [Styela clava]
MASSHGSRNSDEDTNTRQLLKDVNEMILKHHDKATDRTTPVVKFRTPDELASVIDFDVGSDPVNDEAIKRLCEATFEYSVHTDHPRFFNQQFSGVDKYALAGELVVAGVNSNAHTFEVAPVFVMAEKAVIKKALKVFGYEHGEGTFCPGGTYSSMLATNLARYHKFPDVKGKGIIGGPRLVMFASNQAHYSVVKNAALMGIGSDNCIKIACDNEGRMIVSELEKEIQKAKNEGAIPIFVVATAGTTVLGAFDPFNEIADICEKHGIWMHVDGCWGGSLMLSKKYKHICNGIERSDSLAWNPHKMISMPIQCSLLVTKHEGLMSKAHGLDVPYLFQPKKPYDVKYDVSRDLIQCGRRADAFKLWLAWKARGDEGFEKHVDKAMENAEYFLELVKKRDNFRLVTQQPKLTNISFWFIPPSLRNQKEDDEFWEKMHLVAPTIKTRMQKDGTMLVGYQPLESLVNFFRMIVINNRVTHEDIEFVLDEIERKGADL